jgi:hypothetical protein
MAQHVPTIRDDDRAMIHHFIRQTGRAPTHEEVLRSQGLTAWVPMGLGARVRRRAARLIARW